MRVGTAVVGYVVGTTAVPVAWHWWQHHSTTTTSGGVNLVHAGLCFFCGLNVLICVWEIALFRRIDVIEVDSAKLRARYPDTPAGRFSAVWDFFETEVRWTLAFWSKIWSTYSLYDRSYVNRESYGFWIDVGNGHSTILPSLLWILGTTVRGLVSARLLGFLGLLSFYQECYGTVIYFAQFIFNKRYIGKSYTEVLLFVLLSNGIWFFAPILGMYVSYALLVQGEPALSYFFS